MSDWPGVAPSVHDEIPDPRELSEEVALLMDAWAAEWVVSGPRPAKRESREAALAHEWAEIVECAREATRRSVGVGFGGWHAALMSQHYYDPTNWREFERRKVKP